MHPASCRHRARGELKVIAHDPGNSDQEGLFCIAQPFFFSQRFIQLHIAFQHSKSGFAVGGLTDLSRAAVKDALFYIIAIVIVSQRLGGFKIPYIW